MSIDPAEVDDIEGVLDGFIELSPEHPRVLETGEAVRELLRQRGEATVLPTPMGVGPRPFVLERDQDVTGVSGVGVVAEGVQFSDGSVALRWSGEWPTSVVFHDRGIESVLHVHGHDGRTSIVWTPGGEP